MPYTRQECDQLGGDFFPRTGDCLYDRRSYGSSLSDQPYFLMLGVAGAAAVGWYFFVGRR